MILYLYKSKNWFCADNTQYTHNCNVYVYTCKCNWLQNGSIFNWIVSLHLLQCQRLSLDLHGHKIILWCWRQQTENSWNSLDILVHWSTFQHCWHESSVVACSAVEILTVSLASSVLSFCFPQFRCKFCLFLDGFLLLLYLLQPGG